MDMACSSKCSVAPFTRHQRLLAFDNPVYEKSEDDVELHHRSHCLSERKRSSTSRRSSEDFDHERTVEAERIRREAIENFSLKSILTLLKCRLDHYNDDVYVTIGDLKK